MRTTLTDSARFRAVRKWRWLRAFGLTGSASGDEPLQFHFSGNILGKRSSHSVFEGGVGGRFSGDFSFDPNAKDFSPYPTGFYRYIEFRVDGKSLKNDAGTEVPLLAMVIVDPDPSGGRITIRGFYPPAFGDNGDNGSTSLVFVDDTGHTPPNNRLPSGLHLSSFNFSRLLGEEFGVSPPNRLQDIGAITDLYLVPEPAINYLLGTGLLIASAFRWRRTCRTVSERA